MSRFYITTPIYYVNDHPHIGHIYTTIVADVIARYQRLCGDRVYFLTGTDEHGQNIERAASKRGISPQELADEVVSRYHDLWRQLDISHDDFIRTTEPRHRAGVAKLIEQVADSDDFYTSLHEGWYCSSCEAFYTEKELLPSKRCPTHESETEWRSEENLFFRLSKYQEALLRLYDENPGFVRPQSRLNEVRSFVASGLRDLSVSRTNVDWAIPFPGQPGHTVYVWLDALTNYVSALGFGQQDHELYSELWHGGDVRFHLVGKDILRFHAVHWPAYLMSAGLPLPTTVWAHGWWLRDDRKISKSVGNVVRPDELLERFGSDSLRYFLLRDMVFGQDASFSDEAFIDRYNADLANDLGNTISRLVKLSQRAFDGRTPSTCGSGWLEGSATNAVAEFHRHMEDRAFQRALESLWGLLGTANQFLVANEPWRKLGKLDEPANLDQVGEVLGAALEAVRIVASALLPFLPVKAAECLAAIGAEVPENFSSLDWGGLRTNAPLADLEPIFPRIDKKAYLVTASAAAPVSVEESAEEDSAVLLDIDRFRELDLRVASVLEANPIPRSKKLLLLKVDAGEEAPRSVVAGLAQDYQPSELVGRQVVIVANLKPAKLMGVESNGMVLAAGNGRPVILTPSEPVENGARIT